MGRPGVARRANGEGAARPRVSWRTGRQADQVTAATASARSRGGWCCAAASWPTGERAPGPRRTERLPSVSHPCRPRQGGGTDPRRCGEGQKGRGKNSSSRLFVQTRIRHDDVGLIPRSPSTRGAGRTGAFGEPSASVCGGDGRRAGRERARRGRPESRARARVARQEEASCASDERKSLEGKGATFEVELGLRARLRRLDARPAVPEQRDGAAAVRPRGSIRLSPTPATPPANPTSCRFRIARAPSRSFADKPPASAGSLARPTRQRGGDPAPVFPERFTFPPRG